MQASRPSSIKLMQENVSFFNNTAGKDGAAIYTTDLETCTSRRPKLKQEEESYSNYYLDSVFKDPQAPFQFRFATDNAREDLHVQTHIPIYSNNKVLTERKADDIATEPSYFSIVPQVEAPLVSCACDNVL